MPLVRSERVDLVLPRLFGDIHFNIAPTEMDVLNPRVSIVEGRLAALTIRYVVARLTMCS